MFAQSIGEYGALGSLGSGLQVLVYSATSWLGDMSPATWAVVVAVVVIGAVVLRRR